MLFFYRTKSCNCLKRVRLITWLAGRVASPSSKSGVGNLLLVTGQKLNLQLVGEQQLLLTYEPNNNAKFKSKMESDG